MDAQEPEQYACPRCKNTVKPTMLTVDDCEEFRCPLCNQSMGEPMQALIQRFGGRAKFEAQVNERRRIRREHEKELARFAQMEKEKQDSMRRAKERLKVLKLKDD